VAATLTEFQNALAQFLQGQLDLPGLEAVLRSCVQKDPGSAQQILQTLDQLFRSSRLPAQTYITLKQHLSAPQSPVPPAQQPDQGPSQQEGSDIPESVPPDEDEQLLTLRGLAPPASTHTIVETPRGSVESPPESQEQSSDILDILQSGSKEPPATPPASEEPQPSEDKTVFRQSAPPTAPPSQSSVPHTGTGSAARTGPTGATGATGGASVPTGTGSNWTDPSKWGEGAAAVMQPGSILKERYVLETVIGRGGMGVVFKAKDLRREEAQDRNPYIAVKILNDEFRRHPESLKALQRESRKAQDLAHPNIVTVFDFDRDGATVYMTMEYLEGQSLDRYAKDAAFEGMPLSEAYPLIEGLGRALAYAHAKSIVHSDLKPANAFLTKGGVIKVFDFGIARAAKLPGDKSGDMTLFDPGSLGALTPAYASCEMLDGEEPDARDDIYALACIAYEMLTGRHPYDKRPATDARDKGLALAPIKGLSRRNWRGLQRGLAFSRKDRSPNIEVFLEDLKVRKLGKVQIGVGAAAAVGAVAFILLFGPSYLQERRIDNMIEAISDSNNSEMPAVLQRLYELESIEQDIVTGNSQVEDRLIDYFIDEIEAAADVDDYPRAEALIGQALAQYDDSNRLAVARDVLETDKAELLSDLNNRYNAALEAGRILPSDAEGIGEVMERLQKIDPNHPALTDAQLAIAYVNAAKQLLASDVLQAALYIDEGQRRFPGDPELVGLRDRLNTLREVQDRDVAIAELVQKLSGALASIAEIQDFRPFERDILQLEALDPGNRVVGDYRGRLEKLLDATVNAAVARNDWAQARSAVSDSTTLLSQDYRVSTLSRIDAAESNYTDRIGGVYTSVVDAAQRGEFSQAETDFGQLEQLGANVATLGQARDAISRGYRDKARSERAAGRFDAARELIQTGQGRDAGYAGWDSELELIAQAERMQAEGVADQDRREMEQQRVARISSLQDRISQNLNRSPFDLALARETIGSIDDLVGLDPGATLAKEGRGEVAAKLATEARGRGVRDQEFDDALQLVEQSLAILPNEQALIDVQRELRTERQGHLSRIAADQENSLKADLEGLLAAPAYDSSWEASLRRSVQSLEPLAGSGQYLSGKREEIATLYVERAKSLRGEERFDLAETMLSSSEWFVSDFGPASAENRVLADARRVFDAANQERQLSAQIDGLKLTFTTELNAGRFDDAKAALTRLRNLLPSGDSFVANQAPQAIADAYMGVADRALNAGDFERAERFAREGLKEVSSHGALTKLLANIKPMRLESNFAAIKNTIQSAPPTDSARPKNRLAMIRADAGADFAEKEAELISLANQRVSRAGKQRDSVVAWLSNIFPGYVAPALAGTPCTPGLAGYGSRGRGQCFDYLPGSSTEGPRLVVVPAGSGVARAFAIGRQEVSVGQWNAYCNLSGNCEPQTGQNEQFPVTRITVEDARNYASWLSNGTKHTYRLPTDVEWEHAAKAVGSTSISPNCINPQAGLLGDELFEVNRGGQNAWGVMNFVGNAQEWVVGPSGGYQARGGAYKDRLGACTIELSRPHTGNADRLTGFRLVRELGEGA
jgi:serine/threonine protein kinase